MTLKMGIERKMHESIPEVVVWCKVLSTMALAGGLDQVDVNEFDGYPMLRAGLLGGG